jgi:hypothetical protein
MAGHNSDTSDEDHPNGGIAWCGTEYHTQSSTQGYTLLGIYNRTTRAALEIIAH